ncbi:unnamed protein product [Callosobruchus maculatus]|uniref:Uncharacterized protein n=1 Tax=Callosobruchus maculatus TaxID=64391 RepID=A0A653DL59_CALMS|nr:unnamed protein product [Callosobruchus maculatus]
MKSPPEIFVYQYETPKICQRAIEKGSIEWPFLSLF